MKSLIVTLTFTLASTVVLAKGDAKAGAKKAATCVACHGKNGVSSNELWPSLKGQKAGYLAKSLRDFQSGKRKDPLMTPQAKTLKPKDIDNLAAYYSSLK